MVSAKSRTIIHDGGVERRTSCSAWASTAPPVASRLLRSNIAGRRKRLTAGKCLQYSSRPEAMCPSPIPSTMATPIQRGTPSAAAPGHQGEDAEFLIAMGRRVRDAREQRGMARKVLAQTAGVSERYLAQLEAGDGNASVLLLRHFAHALGLPLTELLETQEHPVEHRLIRRFLEQLPQHRLEDIVFRLM